MPRCASWPPPSRCAGIPQDRNEIARRCHGSSGSSFSGGLRRARLRAHLRHERGSCRRADGHPRQCLSQRQGAAAACRHRQGHLRAARVCDRSAPDGEFAQPARGPRCGQVRRRAFGGRQRGGDDRGRQARRGHRLGRRQRHERVLRAGRHQVARRSARPHRRGRCAGHRLCAAGQEDPAAARAQGRRLYDQAGRRRRLPLQGDARRTRATPAAFSICRSRCRPSRPA